MAKKIHVDDHWNWSIALFSRLQSFRNKALALFVLYLLDLRVYLTINSCIHIHTLIRIQYDKFSWYQELGFPSWNLNFFSSSLSLITILESFKLIIIVICWQVLWPNSGWRPIPLVDIIEANAVKKAYQRALLCLHPDKLQQKGASPYQKLIAEKVFDILQVTHFCRSFFLF